MKEIHEFYGDFIPIDTDHYTLNLLDGVQLCRAPAQWKVPENQMFRQATDVLSFFVSSRAEHPGRLPGAQAAPLHPLPEQLRVCGAAGARSAAPDRARRPARHAVRLPRQLPAGDHGPQERPDHAAADAVAVPGNDPRVHADLEQPREAGERGQGGGVRAERADGRLPEGAQVGQLRRPLHRGEAADRRLRGRGQAQGRAAEWGLG